MSDHKDQAENDDRCTYFSTDIVTCRYPREDGWRCGETAGHGGSHVLYSADGERVLYSASWGQRLTTSPASSGDQS